MADSHLETCAISEEYDPQSNRLLQLPAGVLAHRTVAGHLRDQRSTPVGHIRARMVGRPEAADARPDIRTSASGSGQETMSRVRNTASDTVAATTP